MMAKEERLGQQCLIMWALEILRDLNSDDQESSIYVSISSLILQSPES